MVQDANVGSISDYAERLKERSLKNKGREKLRSSMLKTLLSADRHLARFDMSVRRYERAANAHDARTMFVERENMLASLYETIDTVFRVIRMIDADVLDLKASLDGKGIVGEDATFIHDIFKRIEVICGDVSNRENLYNLQVDFSVPVDEREGVTFSHNAHWRDYAGSVERSFYLYFENVQREMADCLSYMFKFGRQRKMQHVVMKYPALAKFLKAIMTANLGEAYLNEKKKTGLTKKIERKATKFVKRHWPIGKKVRAKKSSATL